MKKIIFIKSLLILFFYATQALGHNTSTTVEINSSDDCITIESKISGSLDGDTLLFSSGSFDLSCMPSYTLSKSLSFEGKAGETILNGGGVNGFLLSDGLDFIEARNIEFTNFGRVFSHSTVGITISRLVFDNVVISDSESGVFLSAHVNEAWITNSSFNNISASSAGSAIFLGYKDDAGLQSAPDLAGRIHIDGNNFTNLSRLSGNLEFHAILVRGNQAVITNNIIKNFSCNSNISCESIYAHANNSQILGNNISNAEGSASILLKGHAIGASNHQVKDNVIYTPTSVEYGFNNAASIEIQVDNAVVSGNAIYNPRGYAVLEEAGQENIVITDNHVFHPYGLYVMLIRSSSSLISGNSVIRPIIDASGQIRMFRFENVNGVDMNSIIIRDNNIVLDNQTRTSSDLFLFHFVGLYGQTISNVIIKGNVVTDLGSVVGARKFFIKDNVQTNPQDENNTLNNF